jgi:bifunctional UDP-N-acetylglucosamine pyrophosphorylase/glucosamine-1-phosphate N-acetyltransferase
MPTTPKPPPRKSTHRALAVVVMAAGKGKRLKSRTPKVLHLVCGKPVLWHVLAAVGRVRPDRIIVVVSHGAEDVIEAVRSWGLDPEPMFVDQGEPLGTGHAVMVAEAAVGPAQEVLVLPGDNPLIEGEMLAATMRTHRKLRAAATMLTTELPDARGYGRIVRDGSKFVRIAEDRDATPEERRIREIATSVYAFDRAALFGALPLVGTENSQREYYLPDVLGILRDGGAPVAVESAEFGGALDVNSRATLARATAAMRDRVNEMHMANGVSITDPGQTYIDVGVKIGADTVILPQTFLEGTTKIGSGCIIGPSTRVLDSTIGEGAEVTFSVVKSSKIGPDVTVGPFTHLRQGTELAQGSKAGSFVEIKASKVGRGSKVPHLSYVGDATVGKGVNLGAGTVTVNYDGYSKHRTEIADDARIGSDTMLVAPLKIGKGGVTGAGSVVTKDVPAGALAVERSDQKIVKGYRKRRDAEKSAKTKKG